jgi:hypothetical protein
MLPSCMHSVTTLGKCCQCLTACYNCKLQLHAELQAGTSGVLCCCKFREMLVRCWAMPAFPVLVAHGP